MEPNQKLFLDRLSALAKLTGVSLSPEMIGLYDRALRALGYAKVAAAVEAIIISRRATDRFPSVADIRQQAQPEPDDSDLAVEVANRVIQAVGEFGSWRWRDAQAFIGEIGVYVVQRSGGWASLCNMNTKDTGVYRAQLREMALSSIRRAKLGLLEKVPEFPKVGDGGMSARVSQLVAGTTKTIGGGTNGEADRPGALGPVSRSESTFVGRRPNAPGEPPKV